MNLSLGLRPVWRPVETRNAPPLAEVALAAGDGGLQQRRLEQVVVHLRRAGKPVVSSVTPRIDLVLHLEHRRHALHTPV